MKNKNLELLTELTLELLSLSAIPLLLAEILWDDNGDVNESLVLAYLFIVIGFVMISIFMSFIYISSQYMRPVSLKEITISFLLSPLAVGFELPLITISYVPLIFLTLVNQQHIYFDWRMEFYKKRSSFIQKFEPINRCMYSFQLFLAYFGLIFEMIYRTCAGSPFKHQTLLFNLKKASLIEFIFEDLTSLIFSFAFVADGANVPWYTLSLLTIIILIRIPLLFEHFRDVCGVDGEQMENKEQQEAANHSSDLNLQSV